MLDYTYYLQEIDPKIEKHVFCNTFEWSFDEAGIASTALFDNFSTISVERLAQKIT